MSSYAEIREKLADSGLLLRGGFHPEGTDAVPGDPASLVLVGGAGASFWPAFRRDRRDEPDPLDAWTRRVLDGLAADLGARALYPFGGPPHLPFQCWAARAEGLQASPLGILVHPIYGLWHAYRGALAFPEAIDLPPPRQAPFPCGDCPRPCLTACPVGAFAEGAYDVAACAAHLVGDGAECMERGCLARRACPVGRDFTHPSPLARFHMEAFLADHLPLSPCDRHH